MPKVLFVATVVKKHILPFHTPFLEMFKAWGWETAVAAYNDFDNPDDCVIPHCDRYFNLNFSRSPFNLSNISAYKKLKVIIDKGGYDIIHCHTPVGGVLTRLAARRVRKKGCRLIYTAHGFHFYKNAPLKNWLIFYPIELLLSRLTDTLITINKEDFKLAKAKMKAGEIVYIPGVGVDLNKFGQIFIDREKKRRELNIPLDVPLLISVGELNKNKNHETLIRAIKDMEVYCIISGEGDEHESLQALIDSQHMSDKIKLLGYRDDMNELYAVSDAFVFPSFREELPRSLMEAMACGLPCIVSNIRGNIDLIRDKRSGFFFNPHSVDELRSAIEEFLSCDNAEEIGKHNREVVKDYKLADIVDKMKKIYQ